jgi:uncharacterized protein (TIGR03437 family)
MLPSFHTQRIKQVIISAGFPCALVLLLVSGATAQVVFSGGGTAAATTARNNFRTAIGGVDNVGGAATTTGRREIGWDGVRLDGTDNGGNTTVIVANKITGIPVNRFQNRGAIFGAITAVANDGFASANAGVAGQFPAFSPANTFAAINSNQIEVNFVIVSAATTAPVNAATQGFGVIFLDVEKANTSSIEFFNGTVSLGKYFVPVGPSGEAEFLGVLYNAPIVTKAVITHGEAAIFNFNAGAVTPGQADTAVDQAATDDFILAEPVSLTSANVGVAFAGVGTTDATAARDTFRTAIGGADNAGGAATTTGRREIGWDGVRLDGTDNGNNTTVIVQDKIAGIPNNRFQNRGIILAPLTAVAGDGFVSANPNVVDQFPAFSPTRTFAAVDSNQQEVKFVLVSAATTTPVQAHSRGFGVIFLDVEREYTSSIEYFNGVLSLGKFFVPKGASGQPEFLGVLFNAPIVTRVVVTAGTEKVFNFANGQLTPGGAESATTDLAVVDDFIVAEPVANSAAFNAASYTGSIAPNSISVAFGLNLATDTVAAATNPLPLALAGTTLAVVDSGGVVRVAPLFFASPGQVNYLVPPETPAGDATIAVLSGNGALSTGKTKIELVAPGVFTADSTGAGLPAAVVLRIKATGEQIYEPIMSFDAATQKFVATPIDLGPASDLVYLVMFGTGARNRSSLQAVTAVIGGQPSTVTYAGGQTALQGLDQFNLLIPRTLIGRGDVDVTMTVEGKPTNVVKVNMK